MAVFTIALAVASLMFVTVMHFITRIYGDINTLNESVGTVSESITLTGQLSEIRLKEHELKSSLNGTPGTEGVG